MSVKVMGKVWDMDLRPAEKLVLLALADHSDHAGKNAYPGTKLLAQKTGLSVRQVQRLLDKLEDDKVISKTAGGAGRGHNATYEFTLKKDDKMSPITEPQKDDTVSPISESEIGDTVSSFQNGKGDIHDIEKVTSETGKGDIRDKSHDKERARYMNRPLTVHEPSIGELHTAADAAAATPPKPYELFAAFCDGYEKHYDLPYKPSKENHDADFGQLRQLLKQYGEKFRLEDWRDLAVPNYFNTPQSPHTAKDLANRYAVFRRTALDRFNKPVTHSAANGKSSGSAGDVTRTKMQKIGKDLGILK